MADETQHLATLESDIHFKEFLEKVPPGRQVLIANLTSRREPWECDSITGGGGSYPLNLPCIGLHCDSDQCGGVRQFCPEGETYIKNHAETDAFIRFTCRNCGMTEKTFALRFDLKDDGQQQGYLAGHAYKYGEIPTFGSPTPARVITLLGAEREYYLKGRRAENQGMGIGAFAYYRRVVENQKDKLISEIIRAAEAIGGLEDLLSDLKSAKGETQFSRAVESIRHTMPASLLIKGHNPLTLLHKAISEGIHAQEDDKCLELATSIRVVLVELADRLGYVLKERAELHTALTKLMK